MLCDREDTPEAFEETLPCPECRQDWRHWVSRQARYVSGATRLVDAVLCDDCGEVLSSAGSRGCGQYRKPDNGRVQAFLDQLRGEAMRLREGRNEKGPESGH